MIGPRTGTRVWLAAGVTDIHERQHKLAGTLAHQALVRIGKIFKVEAEISGMPPDERMRVRQARTRPVLDDLKV